MPSFQLTANFGKDWRFDQSQYEIQLEGMNPILVSSWDHRYGLDDVELWKRDDLNSVVVTFTSHDYESDRSALAAAAKIQHAIALMGGRTGGAVDPGFLGMLSEGVTTTARIGPPESFASNAMYSGGGRTIGVSADTLRDHLAEGIVQYPLSIPRLRALAILANHEFPGGLRCSLDDGLGRLVARVSSIEAMCECPRRSERVQACIGQMLESVDDFPGLSHDERRKLKSGISNLKNESISQSCRDLVAGVLGEEPLTSTDHEGDPPAKQFSLAYAYRSKFLHAGRHPDEAVRDLESHDELRLVGWDLEAIVDAIVISRSEE